MSKGEEHKKHHYVPQTYLRQFAHSNGKKKNEKYILTASNRQALKSFPLNVEDACQISYFYTISEGYLSSNPQDNLNALSIELEYFANNVENDLTTILEEIRSRKEDCIKHRLGIFPMVENDKYLLAKQIAIQYLRLPMVRELYLLFNEVEKTNFQKELRLFKHGLAKELNNPDIAKLNIGVKVDEVVLHAQQSFLNEERISTLAQELSDNLWTFVFSPEKVFMTSDNPIICVSLFPNEQQFNLVHSQNGSIKFFAISPDLLLIMTDNSITVGTDCKFGIASDMCITTYHKALCYHSNEVYSYLQLENKFILQ